MPRRVPKDRWRAQVKIKGETLFLGSFSSYDEAAEAERMFREGMGIRKNFTQAENDVRIKKMLEQRSQGMSWKAIGKYHGMRWQTCSEYAYRYKKRAK